MSRVLREFLVLWILFILSDTGQVPVVVTLLDSGTRPADLSPSDVITLNLELIKNKTRSPLSIPSSHNDSAMPSGLSDVASATLASVVSPPGTDNSSVPVSNDSPDSEVAGAPASSPGQEDIPSFREWTQKQLAEAEKKKGENLTVLAATKKISNVKIRSKNYASLDCGAKIVGANAEAKSPNSVLSPSRDEYILSPCTSKIWFVVELCESIQAKKIELANFELFSSSPREFTVSVADRYITKDWTVVGQFTAKDERNVQSFPLSHSLFAKYLRLEFHSHYGAEHFCPVSLLRVFGTSELDVLDSDAHEDNMEEDEEVDETEGGEGGSNIFGNARDAVISIVKKAAEVLTPQTKNATEISPQSSETGAPSGQFKQLVHLTCSSPAHIIVCDNCTDELYHRVYSELSCQRKMIEQLFQASFIERALRTSSLCAAYGLHFLITPDPAYGKADSAIDYGTPGVRKVCSLDSNHREQTLMKTFLPEYRIAALCNHLAILENKVVYNTSTPEPITPQTESSQQLPPPPVSSKSAHQSSLPSPNIKPGSDAKSSSTHAQQYCTVESSLVAFPRTSNAVTDATLALLPAGIRATPAEYLYTSPAHGVPDQISPTKTLDLSDDDIGSGMEHPIEGMLSSVTMLDSPDVMSSHGEVEVLSSDSSEKYPPSAAPAISDTFPPPSSDSLPSPPSLPDLPPPPNSSGEEEKVGESGTPSGIGVTESLENLFSDLEGVSDSASAQQAPPPQQLKESVLIRLANRIKSLERNMSLSTQYLDELSRRYKRQIEELSRSLAATLAEAKRGEAREAKLQAELSVLATQLTSLTIAVESVLSQSESWTHKMSTIGQHTLIILIELVIFVAILFACRILPEVELSQRKISLAWRSRGQEPKTSPSGPTARRKSDSVLTTATEGVQVKRRASEEIVRSSGSTDSTIQNEVTIPQNTSPSIPNSASTIRALNKAEKRRRRRKKDVKLKISSSFNSLPRYSSPSPSQGRFKRTSSSDQISWCPDISTRNAFEPLTLVLQSPQHSPPGDIFTTAMEARRKRSLPNHSHGDNSLSVKNSSQNSNPVRKISQGSSNPVRKNSQGSAAGRKNSPDRLSTVRSHFSHVGDSDRSISNSSSAAGTPKKASGFKKYVKKFF